MGGQIEVVLIGDQFLAFLNDRVHELFDCTAFDAYHVVVMPALIELEDSLVALEIMALHESRRFELCQNTVDSGKPNILSCLQEAAVDVLCGHMLIPIPVQDFEYLRPWQSNLKTGLSEVFGFQKSLPGSYAP